MELTSTITTSSANQRRETTRDYFAGVAAHPLPCLCGAPAVTTAHSHFSAERPACAACTRMMRVLTFIHHDVTVSTR